MFCKKGETAAEPSSTESVASTDGTGVVSLIGPNRSHSIGVLLQQQRLDADKLLSAVMGMDSSALSWMFVEQLLKLLPIENEMAALQVCEILYVFFVGSPGAGICG